MYRKSRHITHLTKTLGGLLILFISLAASAQNGTGVFGKSNWDWWCQNVGGCPAKPWIEYLIISPGFMGPNALPVPKLSSGRITNGFRLENGVQAHFSNGDNTQNLYIDANINLMKDRVSFLLYGSPVEHFAMSDSVRDLRMLSGTYFIPKGWDVGDLYFGTEIQLWKDETSFADVMFRAVTKTASGGKVDADRVTNTPAYFMDFSLGKNLSVVEGRTIRLNAMLGFYVWQTYIERQDDALLYGLGGDIDFEKYKLSSSLAGYAGYKNNRDQPMVWRLELLKKQKVIDWLFQYQVGLVHWQYSSFKFSVIYHTGSGKENKKD